MPTVYAEDRAQLAWFVRDVTRILEQICFNRLVILIARHAGRAEGAWAEMKQQGVIEYVISSIEDEDGDLTDDDIRAAGLFGQQLRFKLSGYHHWRDQVAKRTRDFAGKFSPGGVVERMLQKLLAWANIILKSIMGALPGGHALTEMKDAIEKAIEESVEETT